MLPLTKVAHLVFEGLKNNIHTLATEENKKASDHTFLTLFVISASPRPTITCDLRHFLFQQRRYVIYYF